MNIKIVRYYFVGLFPCSKPNTNRKTYGGNGDPVDPELLLKVVLSQF
jgi:hypothetical protein